MKNNLIVVLCILLAFLSIGAKEVRGQVTTSLERLEIVFWPEYDQPGVLVMLRAWLPADAFLPTYVPLPVAAGVTPSAVAKRDSDGRLLNAAHTVADHGSLREVRIAADTREVRVEYYVPLTMEGTKRRFFFDWPGLIALGSASWELQQPVGATGIAVNPLPQSTTTGFDGLTYLHGDLGRKEMGDAFWIEFSYDKATPNLTVSTIQQQLPQGLPPPAPAAAPAEETPAPVKTGSFPWIVIITVLLIGGLIIIWFLQSGSDS